jgi:hypothetical protein
MHTHNTPITHKTHIIPSHHTQNNHTETPTCAQNSQTQHTHTHRQSTQRTHRKHTNTQKTHTANTHNSATGTVCLCPGWSPGASRSPALRPPDHYLKAELTTGPSTLPDPTGKDGSRAPKPGDIGPKRGHSDDYDPQGLLQQPVLPGNLIKRPLEAPRSQHPGCSHEPHNRLWRG